MEAIWKEPLRENTVMRIFRGQTDDWPLLPKLFRTDRTQNELRNLEHMLMCLFEQRCLFLLPSVPEGQYDKMSLAQHYGLPTRLLDWSSNPLMALFFAVDTLEPAQPTVWVYDVSQEQRDAGNTLNRETFIQDHKLTPILNPSRHSQRVVAQAGWHTVHSLPGAEDDSVRVQPMNEADDAKRLTSVTIEPQKARAIKRELWDMGIHSATVYGDLTSVCREIQDHLEIPSGMRGTGGSGLRDRQRSTGVAGHPDPHPRLDERTEGQETPSLGHPGASADAGAACIGNGV